MMHAVDKLIRAVVLCVDKVRLALYVHVGLFFWGGGGLGGGWGGVGDGVGWG